MAATEDLDQAVIIHTVRAWLNSVVIGLNLCPFAKRELAQERIRFAVTAVATDAQLLTVLSAELDLLNSQASVATTLLIHPKVLTDFYDYNQFLGDADALLRQRGLEGVYQIASFHPDYQFADTEADDAENYSNKSPYPMLHLLREDAVAQAIDTHADTEQIPERNIVELNRIGRDKLQALLAACTKARQD